MFSKAFATLIFGLCGLSAILQVDSITIPSSVTNGKKSISIRGSQVFLDGKLYHQGPNGEELSDEQAEKMYTEIFNYLKSLGRIPIDTWRRYEEIVQNLGYSLQNEKTMVSNSGYVIWRELTPEEITERNKLMEEMQAVIAANNQRTQQFNNAMQELNGRHMQQRNELQQQSQRLMQKQNMERTNQQSTLWNNRNSKQAQTNFQAFLKKQDQERRELQSKFNELMKTQGKERNAYMAKLQQVLKYNDNQLKLKQKDLNGLMNRMAKKSEEMADEVETKNGNSKKIKAPSF